MEEYEISKSKEYNHFDKCRELALLAKRERIINRINSKKKGANMNWHTKLRIQKLSHGNPFADRIKSSSLLIPEN